MGKSKENLGLKCIFLGGFRKKNLTPFDCSRKKTLLLLLYSCSIILRCTMFSNAMLTDCPYGIFEGQIVKSRIGSILKTHGQNMILL